MGIYNIIRNIVKHCVIITGICAPIWAQDPVVPTPYQVMDTRTGVAIPCVGCSIYTYLQGTNVPLATYTDHTLGTPNTNPVITNSSGYAAGGDGSTITGIWVGFSCYKFTLKDANSVTIWTQDSICDQALLLKTLLAGATGALQIGYEPTGGTVVTTVGAALNSAFIYDVGFSSAAAACASSITVAVTKQSIWTGVSSLTCSAPLWFPTGSGVSIKPASGQTVSFKATAGLSQICDVSAGGKCIISTPNSEVYPEWWGAVAGQDSTVAFQAALNMISSTTQSMKLIIPNNNTTAYQISTTLTYTGSSDFGSSLVMEGIVSGAGGRGSILLWTGASGGILMHVTDCHKCRINHVSFQGNALALTDFWLDASDTVGSTQSADDSFDDVSISGMAGTGSIGLRISHTGCTNADVAEIAVRNSQIIGNNSGLDTGISYECGGNSKNLTSDNNVVESLGTGLFVESSGFGWLNLLGTYFANNQIDMQVPLGSLNVIGGGSEGSFKLFDMGAGQNICNLTMIGFYWSGNTISNDNIGTSSGCSIDISGSKFFNGRTPTSLPRIVLSSGFPPLGCTGVACGMPSLTSHANFFLNTDTTHGAYYDNGGSPLGVYYGTYAAASVNINQAPIQVWGDYGGVSEALKFPLPNYSFAQPRILTPTGPTGPCTPPELTYDTAANLYLCTASAVWNAIGVAASYIGTEVGANTAIAGNPAIPSTLAAGLQVRIKLAHSLQVGANTFAYSGGSAVAIKSSRNPANDIGTAYVSGGFINLTYTGSVWVDGSQ